MTVLLSTFRIRLSSVALGAALLFALGGLIIVDRALSNATREQAQLDALEAAASVENFLAVHVEALQSVRGLYLDTTHTLNVEYFRAVASSIAEYGSAFNRLWITDSNGVIRDQFLFGGTRDSLQGVAGALDADTILKLDLRSATGHARASGRLQIAGPGQLFNGMRGLALVNPVYVGSRFAGFVGATIPMSALDSVLHNASPHVAGPHTLIVGSDTVGTPRSDPRPARSHSPAVAPVRTPGGGEWRIAVMENPESERLRVMLWSIGLATLGALIVAALHERHEKVRMVERTSELERLSVELLRANRMKSEFLANVSHELRTPLNAIVGFVELLRDGVYGDLSPRQVSPVDRIASSATHLRQLVDQVLDLARMAAGRLEVHRESIELRPFVLEVTGEIEPLAAERGLALSVTINRSLPRVRTDPLHLRQILTNLLGNALKYTRSGGIAVRARVVTTPGAVAKEPPMRSPAQSGWVIVQVADTGVGIADSDQERVFEEFEQVNAGSRADSQQRGTGLGLAISRRLARLLEGDLTLESDLGKGSTFTLWLPVTATDLAVRPDDAAARLEAAWIGTGPNLNPEVDLQSQEFPLDSADPRNVS